MGINWQDVFYVTASLAMIAVFATCIWLMRLFFIASRLAGKLSETTRRWSRFADDINYFRNGIKSNILRFLLKILNKGDHNEQQ